MSRRSSSGISNSDVDNVTRQVFDDCLDEIILGVSFDIHRSVKTGLFAVLELDSLSPSKKGTAMDTSGSTNYAVDVFGQVISTHTGVPALKKQPECTCPNCQRNLAASRFAPHLEKCMGMGRNSSRYCSKCDKIQFYKTLFYFRLASRRLATSGKEANYKESGEGEDEDDEEWIEPTKVSSNIRRRHRDKNSPRRTKISSSSALAARLSSYTGSSSSKEYYVFGADGTVTPPSNYDILSGDERANLLSSMCGVITAASKKICTRSIRCPIHTEAQRREVRNRWLNADDETHVDIDR